MPFHTRLLFSYPGTNPYDEAEQEATLEKSSQHGVTEKENFIKEEGLCDCFFFLDLLDVIKFF